MTDIDDLKALAETRFGAAPMPPELSESIDRHKGHLVGLVAALRTAGVDSATIETSVDALVECYKAELVRAIRRMLETSRHD